MMWNLGLSFILTIGFLTSAQGASMFAPAASEIRLQERQNQVALEWRNCVGSDTTGDWSPRDKALCMRRVQINIDPTNTNDQRTLYPYLKCLADQSTSNEDFAMAILNCRAHSLAEEDPCQSNGSGAETAN